MLAILVVFFSLSKQPKFFPVPSWLQRFFKSHAITLPPFGMFFSHGHFVESTIRHELVHWEQYNRYGVVGFYLLYLYYTIKYGYWENPMEIEAYQQNVTYATEE